MGFDALGERIEFLIVEMSSWLEGIRIDGIDRNISGSQRLGLGDLWRGTREWNSLNSRVSGDFSPDRFKLRVRTCHLPIQACISRERAWRRSYFVDRRSKESGQATSESTIFSHVQVPPCIVRCTRERPGNAGHKSEPIVHDLATRQKRRPEGSL